jgi:3-(methylthio)propanoyl-CoA dehydrogenase
LLPIVKTVGAETAFDVASGAVQVLGGAGYTREWPVEQAVRDARVLPVFEGTTGMQGLDLVHRRLLRGDGLEVFLRVAQGDETLALAAILKLLKDAGLHLRAMDTLRDVDAGATSFLHLASLAATGWIAARLTQTKGATASASYLRAAGGYWLNRIEARALPLHAAAVDGASSLAGFEAIRH